MDPSWQQEPTRRLLPLANPQRTHLNPPSTVVGLGEAGEHSSGREYQRWYQPRRRLCTTDP